MQRRAYVVLALVFVAVIGSALWLGIRQREPVYQGKPLSYWVRQQQPWWPMWHVVPNGEQPHLPTADSNVSGGMKTV